MSEQTQGESSFYKALRAVSAIKIAELGASGSGFIEGLVLATNWTDSMEIHVAAMAIDSVDNVSFDAALTAAGSDSDVVFSVVKHEGSDEESLDSLMNHGMYDAIYVSSASSSESLLASLMACNECLRVGGILGLGLDVSGNDRLSQAVSAFAGMYSLSYNLVRDGEAQWFEKISS